MRRISPAAGVMVMVLLAGCGASGGEGASKAPTTTTTAQPASASPTDSKEYVIDRDTYVEGITGFIDGFDDPQIDTCVAEGLVDAIGVGELNQARVTPRELRSGAFIEELGLRDDALEALGAQVGKALRSCGAIEVFLGALASSPTPRAISADEVACAADAVAEPMGAWLLTGLQDPDLDNRAEGEALAPIVWARCPDLTVEMIAGQAEEADAPLTDEERGCMRDALVAAGRTRSELESDAIDAAILPCLAN